MPNSAESFVKKDKFSTFLKEGVDKVIQNSYNDIDSEVIDSSEVTQCDRRIYYKLINGSVTKTHSVSMHKETLITKWISILAQIKGLKIMEYSTMVADHNYSLVSTVDMIGKMEDLPVVIKLIEVKNETFQNDKAVRKHVVDVMSQMWMAEVSDGFLIYENMLSKEFNIFHILQNVSVLNAVKSKMKSLQEKKMLGILPDRKYETLSTECSECCFKDKCWS
jgi:hypothetical protein